MPPGSPWTSVRVGEELIAAFRRLPDHPVMSRGRRFTEDDGAVVEPFAWPERYLDDAWDRRIVMNWARCRAVGASVAQRYDDLGWNRDTADRRRRRALATIARALSGQAGCGVDLTVQTIAPEPA